MSTEATEGKDGTHGKSGASATAPRKKVGLVSLGCPKNQVDGELMLGRLIDEGHELTNDPSQADVVIVNTCGFIDEAKQESIDAIFESSRAVAGRGGRVVVTGCLSQRYPQELSKEMPEVAAFVPLGDVEGVGRAVAGEGERLGDFPDPYGATFLDDASRRRILTTSPGSAYLKISEGCDHVCAFCAIPSMRGRHRSRPADDLVREAEALSAQGVRELVLVAQDSSAFGLDRNERHALAALLPRLGEVSGIEWVRVMYAYPSTLDEATLHALADVPQACRYLDIPLQHASRDVLKAMRRGGSAKSLASLLDRARRTVPDLVIRTTFISGFPGETDADHEELCAFVRDQELDHVGVFTYSPQEGTTAHPLGDPVLDELKADRRDEILEIQAPISRARNERRIGSELEVLVEGVHPESEHLLVGRWRGQAPEVDGTVVITDGVARPGTIARAVIDAAHEYDLVAHLAGAPAPPPDVESLSSTRAESPSSTRAESLSPARAEPLSSTRAEPPSSTRAEPPSSTRAEPSAPDAEPSALDAEPPPPGD